ncbi:MAG: hypothetical protein QM784_22120 [Polyangiaceae bacterium]
MSLLKSIGAGYENQASGVDKLRGLDNSALRHALKAEREAATAETTSTRSSNVQEPSPNAATAQAAVVTIGSTSTDSGTYSRRGAVANGNAASGNDAGVSLNLHMNERLAAKVTTNSTTVASSPTPEGTSAFTIGDGSNVQINQRGAGSGSGSLVVGDDSMVHINRRGTASGSGSIVVGDGSNVHINQRGADSGSGALVVGDDSMVHINQRGTGSGSAAVGNDAKAKVNQRDASGDSASVVVSDNSSARVNDRIAELASSAMAASARAASGVAANPLAATTSSSKTNPLAESGVASNPLSTAASSTTSNALAASGVAANPLTTTTSFSNANSLAARGVASNPLASTESFTNANALASGIKSASAKDVSSSQSNTQNQVERVLDGLDEAALAQKLSSKSNNGKHLGRDKTSMLDPKLQIMKQLVEKTLTPHGAAIKNSDEQELTAANPSGVSDASETGESLGTAALTANALTPTALPNAEASVNDSTQTAKES